MLLDHWLLRCSRVPKETATTAESFVDLSQKTVDSFSLLAAEVLLTHLPVFLLLNPQLSVAVGFLHLRRQPGSTPD